LHAGIERADIARRNAEHTLAGGCGDERRIQTQLVRGLACKYTIKPHRGRRIIVCVQDRAGEQRGSHGMKQIFKGRHDPEIAAAAANAPKQVRVFGCARLQQPAVRSHDFGCHQIVARQTMFAAELAKAAPDRQPGNACVGVDPHRRGQAMSLRCRVELSQVQPGLRTRDTADRIDLDLFHAGEVDHQSGVTHRTTGDIVATGANSEEQLV